MKILCNPNKEDGKRHYRKFRYRGTNDTYPSLEYYTCRHCGCWIFKKYEDKQNKKLKNHTCKARLKELREHERN